MKQEKKDAPVAQLVEHLTLNQGVQGSNPCGCTKKEGERNVHLSFFCLIFFFRRKKTSPTSQPLSISKLRMTLVVMLVMFSRGTTGSLPPAYHRRKLPYHSMSLLYHQAERHYHAVVMPLLDMEW